MARPAPTSRGQLHVGRYLAALLAILAALYATVWIAGPGSKPLTPKLALDLQGGASVILKAQPDNGQPVRPDQLQTAVEIIQRRVNGAGVSEAEVVTQGNNIVVSVPGGTRESLARVAQTAQLRFRQVLEELPGSPQAARAAQPPVVPAPPAQPKATLAPPSAKASAQASAAASPRPKALSAGLLADPTPAPAASAPPAAPAAPAQPAASGKPAASAKATKAPAVVPAANVHSGDAYTPQTLAGLDCSRDQARQGGSNDQPGTPIVACSDDGQVKYHLDVAKVVGTDVAGATAALDPQTGTQWQILVNFTGAGQDKFTKLTAATIGKQVAIVLDGVVLSAPTIQDRIAGQAQITGTFTQASSQSLANTLKFGALPLSFQPQQEEVVSPTLGKDQLHSGLLAGGLGLLAVVLYSLLYYRALGIVTIASLLISGALTYACICILGKQIGFALSLAGIAGFIVAVGITADSFIVYFERLKDEIKTGRTPRSAVDRAWMRARRTILSADTVSILAAVALYFFSVGGVRGFAFTLGLSTLLDVLIVFLFTRPLVTLLSRYSWFSRSGPTGFFGPDGGQPLARGPVTTRRTTSAAPVAGPVTPTLEA